ncbi:Glycosyltransferase involved in cell wall bisynthesis [Andreprevotia lacus DSM 23236]|jgi:glycosyltransferase involved in cell wall biosynthesis|uniref:Glycosyltransferase involved in cell wall bisynthesis n=1 Tax=Andreprevotia lacus DSM 23236 TaxID=1121001 RepID=A0A1W1XXU1_9NEIS|nr:glycosyltransferase [Andreprevotia lacus]SMC28674.1 Glycosyltransferase involved in cell wall bisynthesis [Andreprevotia lacus DSM 23236]
MKVLFLVRDLGLGGVERCVALVGEGLAERGIEVTVALLAGNRNLWAGRTGALNIVDLSSRWHGRKPWTWLAGWCAVRKLARGHDVVIAATFLSPLYMAYLATRGLGKRVLGWVHGPLAELDAFARMNPLHRRACQLVYRRVAELVFVSQHALGSMGRWLGQPPGAQWRVLPNFVDARQPVPAPQQGDGVLRVLFVGRIAEEKQPHLWLDTLAALNARGIPAELTVVGDGPLQGWLEQAASERGLRDQLQLAGRRDNVSDYLARADVLLLTSNFEGCPLVVLEALAAGVPVASTDAGGVYELFAERRADFVTTEASGDALAALIAAQQPQREALQRWMRQRAQHYAASATLAQWQTLLEQR